MIFPRFIISFLCLFFGMLLSAQERPSIITNLDKDKILIGEPLILTLRIIIPGGAIVKPVLIDSIPHFEFLEKPVIDTIHEGNGLMIKGVYRLTSFDSGHWVIPSWSLSSLIRSDTLPVDVVFSDFDPNQDYHDIKDILAVNVESKKKKWWIYIAIAVLALTGLIIWLKRKRKPIVSSATRDEDPYREAIKQLDILKVEKTDPRQYYSRLTGIFRVYVYKKKKILSLQKTTDDLIIQIQSLGLTRPGFDQLAQALRLSDFVKFAKYIPQEEDDRISYTALRNAIEEIERLAHVV